MTMPPKIDELLDKAVRDLRRKKRPYVTCTCGKRIFSEHTGKYITEFHYRKFLFWGRIVTIHKCWNCWN